MLIGDYLHEKHVFSRCLHRGCEFICVCLQPISKKRLLIMQKNLVIVESPAKAKTIEKFLGTDYKVMSSYGHIRDLKTKEFSIDIAHNYTPE